MIKFKTFAKTFNSFISLYGSINQAAFKKESDAKEFADCINGHHFYNNSYGHYTVILNNI